MNCQSTRALISTSEMVGHYVNLASNDIIIQHQRCSPLDRLNLCRRYYNRVG